MALIAADSVSQSLPEAPPYLFSKCPSLVLSCSSSSLRRSACNIGPRPIATLQRGNHFWGPDIWMARHETEGASLHWRRWSVCGMLMGIQLMSENEQVTLERLLGAYGKAVMYLDL